MSRPVPHDTEAEQATLGSIIIDQDRFGDVGAIVGPVDFFLPDHQRVFRAMLALHTDGRPIDVQTLLSAVGDDIENPAGLLGRIAQAVPHPGNAKHYAETVKDRSVRRQLLRLGDDLVEFASNGQAVAESIEDARCALDDIGRAGGIATGRRATLILMSDIEPQPIEWLWPGRIALGKLTMLAGDPGLGKSFLSLDIGARISLGSPWPDDRDALAPEGSVVLLSAEDDPSDTIRPRLDAAGARCERIALLSAIMDGSDEKTFSLERDIPTLDRAVDEMEDCRLVIIDPISAYTGDSTDSHKNSDVRRILAPLAKFAQDRRLAVLAVTHLNKGQGRAMYRAMGSLAFVAAARAVWLVVEDKDDKRRRLVLPLKNNIAQDRTGLAYEMVAPEGGIPVIGWDPNPVEVDLDAALAPSDEDGGKTADAAEWLTATLADGPVPTKDLQRLAKESGLSWRTVERSKRRIGARAYKEGAGQHGCWYWTLTTEGP